MDIVKGIKEFKEFNSLKTEAIQSALKRQSNAS